MDAEARILSGRVAVRIGPVRMSFPDEPRWWAVMQRTAEAVAELGTGDPDAGRG